MDREVAAFVRAQVVARGGAERPADLALDEADGYTLLLFARRAAVFSLRDGDASSAQTGLDACALVDAERIDYRDILVALALLDHVFERVGADRFKRFLDASELASAATATLMADYPKRPTSGRDLRDACGLVETEGEVGVGLMGWGFKRWEPTLDVAGAIIEIGVVISAGDYVAADPTIAIELPDFWLRGVDDAALARILGASGAIASVSGRMCPEVDATFDDQQLVAFLVETPNAAATSELVSIEHRVTGPFASTAIGVGRLFALVVARSFVAGVASVEDHRSLARFQEPVRSILSAHGNA